MNSIIDPNADYLWGSVSVTSTAMGFVEKAPRTKEDWDEERRHAISLMEATNLLQIPGRPVALPGEKPNDPRVEEPPEIIQTLIDSDRANWTKYTQAFTTPACLCLGPSTPRTFNHFKPLGKMSIRPANFAICITGIPTVRPAG